MDTSAVVCLLVWLSDGVFDAVGISDVPWVTVSSVTVLVSFSLSVDVCDSLAPVDNVCGSLDFSAVVCFLVSLSDRVFDSVGVSDVLCVTVSSVTVLLSVSLSLDVCDSLGPSDNV